MKQMRIVRWWKKKSWLERVQAILIAIAVLALLVEAALFISSTATSLTRGVALYVEPEHEYLEATYTDPVKLQFEVSSTNAPFCKETCSYTLRNPSTGETIAQERLGERQESVELLVQSANVTYGYSTYQLIVSCENTQTLRCRSPDDAVVGTATTVVKWDVPQAQQEARKAVEQQKEVFTQRIEQDIARAQAIIAVDDARVQRLATQAQVTHSNSKDTLAQIQQSLNTHEYQRAYNLIQAYESHELMTAYTVVQREEQEAVRTYNTTLAQFATLRATLTLTRNDTLSEHAFLASVYARAFETTQPTTAELAFTQLTTTLASVQEQAIAQANTYIGAAQNALNAQEQERCTAQNNTNTTCTNSTLPRTNNTIQGVSILRALCANSTLHNTTWHNSTCPLNEPETYIPRTPLRTTLPNLTITVSQEQLVLPAPQCCANGQCQACSEQTTPIIFVHGHSFSARSSPQFNLRSMSRFGLTLQNTTGRVYVGTIFSSSDYATSAYENINPSTAFTTTYYYDSYAEEGETFLVTRKSENIETYSIRLAESIDELKRVTGQDKVIIVAHSMGGLVARRYMQIFGEGSVDKLVMIGTPNNGVEDFTGRFCPIVGADRECEDMKKGSVFLQKINGLPPPNIPVLTIAGQGCNGRHDGVVRTDSVLVPFGETLEVNGTCSGSNTLHSDMLNPHMHPEVFEAVRTFIG